MPNYLKQAWADNDPTKPVSAARMAYLETGVEGSLSFGSMVPSIEAHGHSWMAAFGAAKPKHGMAQRVAQAMGVPLAIDTAISGGLAVSADYQGGPARLFESKTWDTEATSGPYFTPGGLKLLMMGYNDGSVYGTSGNSNGAIDNAMATLISTMIAARRIPVFRGPLQADPAFTFGSGWTLVQEDHGLVDVGMLPGFAYAQANGSYVDYSLDSTYNGEGLSFIFPLNGPNACDFTATLSVGGVTKATTPVGASSIGPRISSVNFGYATLCARIPAGTLPPGAQTVRLTLSAIGTTVGAAAYGTFGGVIIEGNAPLGLLLMPRRPSGGPNVVGGLASDHNARALYSNDRCTTVAATFGSNVKTINLESAMCPNLGTGSEVLDDVYWYDYAHPNSMGYARCAGVILDALPNIIAPEHSGQMNRDQVAIPRDLPKANRLAIFGHSGAEPYGVYHSDGWPAKVARALGAEEVNYALSGAILARPDSFAQPGGYATVLNWIRPFLPSANLTTKKRNVRKNGPYIPFADVYAVQSLSNDSGVSTSVPRSMAMSADTLYSLIACRARAGAVYSSADTATQPAQGLTYGGTGWSVNATGGLGMTTDGTLRQSAVVGDYIEFQTPTDFPGEAVFAFGVGWLFGGQIEFRDTTAGTPGTLLGTFDMNASGGTGIGGPAASNLRITAKAVTTTPGQRKIRATITSITGNNDGTTPTTVGFDSVSITALNNLPTVALINHPDAAGLTTSTTGDAIEQACMDVAARFPDGKVVVADMRRAVNSTVVAGTSLSKITPGSPNGIFRAVDGHANELGHVLETGVVLDAIAAAPKNVRGSQVGSGHKHFRFVQPTGTATYEATFASPFLPGFLSLSPDGSFGVQYSRSADGQVIFKGGVTTVAANPSPTSQMLERKLPSAYRPSEIETFTCPVYNPSTFAIVGQGVIVIAPDGAIVYLGGLTIANAYMSFAQVSYDADGGFPL